MINRSMEKVKAILHTFSHFFIPNAFYYKKLVHISLFFSLRTYGITVVLMSFVTTSIIALTIASPRRIQTVLDSGTAAFAAFPEGAHITITNGSMTMDQDRPLFLWAYYAGKHVLLLAASSSTEATQSTHNAIVFLGPHSLSYRVGTFYSEVPYGPGYYQISRSSLNSFTHLVEEIYLPVQKIFYILLYLVLPFLFFIWWTTIIFFIAILIYLLFHLFIKRVSLKKCFQAGLHSTSLPIILSLLLLILFPTSTCWIGSSFLLLFLFMLVAVYEVYVD